MISSNLCLMITACVFSLMWSELTKKRGNYLSKKDWKPRRFFLFETLHCELWPTYRLPYLLSMFKKKVNISWRKFLLLWPPTITKKVGTLSLRNQGKKEKYCGKIHKKKIRVWPPVILLFMVARTSEVEIKEEATCNVQFVQACAMCNLKCELQWAMCNACTHLRGGDKRAPASRGHLQCSVCAVCNLQCELQCAMCTVQGSVCNVQCLQAPPR